MIQIKVQYYSVVDGKYHVTLGNGTNHVISSEKKCLKFLVKTSNFLTDNYNTLNLIYSDIFVLYRQIYFYFDDNRHTRHAERYENRRTIKKLLVTIEDLFEKLSFSNNNSQNNTIQFLQLNTLIDSLLQIVCLIKQINLNKSYASTQIKADFLLKQITDIQTDLKNYSLKKATSFTPPNTNAINSAYQNLLKIVS